MLRTVEKRKKTRLNEQSRKEERAAYLFVLIPIIGFLLFTLAATSYSFFLSFNKYNIHRETMKFVGFDNYATLFQSEEFGNSVLNTVVLLLSIPLGISIGLLLAVY